MKIEVHQFTYQTLTTKVENAYELSSCQSVEENEEGEDDDDAYKEKKEQEQEDDQDKRRLRRI